MNSEKILVRQEEIMEVLRKKFYNINGPAHIVLDYKLFDKICAQGKEQFLSGGVIEVYLPYSPNTLRFMEAWNGYYILLKYGDTSCFGNIKSIVVMNLDEDE